MNEENKKKQKIRTPLSVMLDMAKGEIGNHAVECMKKNNIPPELMVYVLKDILLDITQMKAERLSEEFISLQASMKQEE